MVNDNGSSRTRTHVYESLYLISHLTEQLIYQLDRLRSAKVVAAGIVEQEKEAARELRAVITASCTVNLHGEEVEAAGRHQKNRMRMQAKLAQTRSRIKSVKK